MTGSGIGAGMSFTSSVIAGRYRSAKRVSNRAALDQTSGNWAIQGMAW
jgi:hypothetical protein